ncbi:MAG: DUF1499 domain-containing protein [Nevskiales bacterium]
MKLSGKRPTNLGVTNGKLAPCPSKPNCVSSQAPDKAHAIAPLAFKGDAAAAMQKLKKLLESMPRTQIVDSRADYLYAECSTAMMGFVDDVEFYCDGKVIHARSASRLGYSDWSVNRKRIEAIRAAFSGG